MRSRVLIGGQAVHPMLVVVPLALLTGVVVFDVLYLVTGQAAMAQTAGHLLAAGVMLGFAAAAGEWLEWWFVIPRGNPVRRPGLWHAAVNVAFVALFAASGVLRADQPDWRPGALALATAWAGLIVGGVSVWLGARLGANGPAKATARPADKNLSC